MAAGIEMNCEAPSALLASPAASRITEIMDTG